MRNSGETISAKEAGKILGCNPQAVRERIRLGIWTFGECIPKSKTGNKSDTFIIYRRKLYKHMGMDFEEKAYGAHVE